MNPATHGSEVSAVEPMLHMASELSNKSWRVAFGDGQKQRPLSVDAGDLVKLNVVRRHQSLNRKTPDETYAGSGSWPEAA